MADMPALAAQHLRKSFGSQVVLDDATFSLARGERVALIGANGAGKSTLARILAGLDAPDGGTLSVRRGLTIRYLSQEPELDPAATARAVVEEALSAWKDATTRHAQVTAELEVASDPSRVDALLADQADLDDAIQRLGGWDRGHVALGFLHQLGVRDVDATCGARSGGERRRIALAQLLVASPDIAILDEPTNHLDADTAAWLEQYLANDFAGAIVLVTHDRYFLDAVSQRIIELERGRLTSFPGGYGDYLDKRAELLAQENRVEQNRQNTLRREREWLARGPKARATKQKARIQRALELEARGPATAGRPGEVTLVTAAARHQGKTVLELSGVQVAAARGEPPLNAPFDLIVRAGERIGIVGPNGVGKTTLVRVILAALDRARGVPVQADGPVLLAGSITVGKNTRAAYLDQSRADLDDAKSIFEDVRGEGGTTVALGVRGRESMDLRSYLELFLFDPHKQRQKVGSLSGGERARVALAKVIRQGQNVLIFDEPTNDLDLPTLSALEEMLESYEGSVLVVTHDRAFLDGVATAILAFDAGPEGREAPATVTRYAGGYQDYVAQKGDSVVQKGDSVARKVEPARKVESAPKEEGRLPSQSHPPGVAPTRAPAKEKAKRGLTYAERLELDTILQAVEAGEKGVAEVESLLADPRLYTTRGGEVAGLQARLERARSHLAALVARWETLESAR
jgi:ATP-binding cassette subfamily F protein uup